jgi:hypothetical protein
MMDKRLLEILSYKPDLISDFPAWMLQESTIYEIRRTEHVAIGEIAGRDSIAAVIRACELRPIKAIIPTIAFTGTEYGSWEVPFRNVEILKERLQKSTITIYDPIVLGSPEFWRKLCGRYTAHLFRKFGFFSPCVGCHLYFHAIRIPLSKKLNCSLVIGGERESHNGKIKINQIGAALDSYTFFLKQFGIELSLPLRYVMSGKGIETIIGQQWEEGEQQLECVLSKNYREADDSVIFDEESIIKYFDEFAFRTAEESINKYLSI